MRGRRALAAGLALQLKRALSDGGVPARAHDAVLARDVVGFTALLAVTGGIGFGRN